MTSVIKYLPQASIPARNSEAAGDRRFFIFMRVNSEGADSLFSNWEDSGDFAVSAFHAILCMP
jgi:hypothetical protein